jgi:hypothetical protein
VIVEKSTYSRDLNHPDRSLKSAARRTCQPIETRACLCADSKQFPSVDVQVNDDEWLLFSIGMSGISPFTQADFELANEGLWKPPDHSSPPNACVLKLLQYQVPFFDIEMYVINEKDMHLTEVMGSRQRKAVHEWSKEAFHRMNHEYVRTTEKKERKKAHLLQRIRADNDFLCK